MAISEAFANSETVGTTEHSMTTDTAGPDVETSDGVFQPFIDFSNMATGDEYQIAIYEKVNPAATPGDTQRLLVKSILKDAQSPPIWTCPALILMHGWDMTLKKIAGTDRLISWSIRKVA